MTGAFVNVVLRAALRWATILGDHPDHEVEEAGPLAHREHGGRKIQSEPIIFREPAELGSGEGRLEDPAHAVTAPSNARRTRPRNRCLVGPHERRTPLGGDHQAGGDLGLRLEYIRR